MRTTTRWTRTAHVVTCAVAGVLLLAGCGGQAAPPVGDQTSTRASSQASSAAPSGAGQEAGGSRGPTDDPKGPTSAPAEEQQASEQQGSEQQASEQQGSEQQESEQGGSAQGDTDPDDGTVPGIEMPAAPEEEVTSLSELLGATPTAPLVRRPLPAAASARGRLVAGYPALLRPTRSSRVETSSVSPSGDRLQVSLVGSSTLASAQVLVAFRTRLSGRGLTELKAPAAVAGASAAAFRRGDSVVTVTVEPRSGRTSYSVHATLRAGSE